MQIYTISYNMPKDKGISIDFLSLVAKLCRSLPYEAYVQGVSLQSGVLTIRSPKPIKNLRDLAIKHTTDKYTINTISTTLPPY